MDDLISRQAAIDAVADGLKSVFVENRDVAETLLKNLPSAQPEREKSNWTPVSKTIEIPEHEIIACNKYDHQMMGYLFYSCGQWICEGAVEIMYDVVAWAEKLEPYKGDEHENN